jgi:mRNA interferase RelE/StbE
VYRIRLLDAAARELARLDKDPARRIVDRMRWLAENVETAKPEALGAKLSGLYKLRVGDYRVVYELLGREETIIVHKIGHRSEIYRTR